MVFLAEEVFLGCAERHHQFLHLQGQLINALGVSRH